MMYIEMSGHFTHVFYNGHTMPKHLTEWVIEVQADCDELDSLYARYPHLNRTSGRVVRFFGAEAKFIVGNW